MKGRSKLVSVGALACALVSFGCEKQEPAPTEPATAEVAAVAEVSNVPPLDENNIVSIAIRSEDHTTLVTAIKAADYVTSVAASGPLTVFAPTNEAFAKLPAGTVENLIKPENVGTLRKILQYHVTTSALDKAWLKDGQSLGMANGQKTTVHVDGDVVKINDATIIASVPASNGMLHVVDTVLLPPEG